MALRLSLRPLTLRAKSSFLPHERLWFAHGGTRTYIPITPEEEEEEKTRVASLSSFQKDQELRKYNREIARLEALKGINTGERYTWSGRYKALARDYGMPLVAYYWVCWGVSFVGCFGAITLGGLDAMAIVAKADTMTGWDLTSKVDPELGKLGVTLVLNELIEPIRMPLVITTVKPVMDQFFPPKF